jgi:hypothetical protein
MKCEARSMEFADAPVPLAFDHLVADRALEWGAA